jgi:glycosyltransferase involved in cell wall biosynthesis
MSFKANQPLVSIIIPCYNCAKWVRETVESCLNQTYSNIEIIVVDDGSTDGSLEVLRQFVPRIRLETGPNRGGNSARNTGFALSTGEYIQYLDADDYLEPEKIFRQVLFLEETKADVVYGDWRLRRHLPDSSFSYLDRIQVTGVQQNILASLLSFWLVNGGAVLYRRQVVNQVGGWDETLRAFQDMDFLTSVALSGAKIRYQPGCYFIYRKYGAATISTSNFSVWSENTCISLKKSEVALARTGRLTEEYRAALAVGYFKIAESCYWFEARASFTVYQKTINNIIDKILDLSPHFNAAGETHVFQCLQWLFGFRFAMHLLFRVRSAIRLVKSKLKNTFLLRYVLGIRRERIFQREAKRHSCSTSADVGRKGQIEQERSSGPR